MPVLFGPNIKKFKEARDLIEVGGGFSIKTKEEFNRQIEDLWNNTSTLHDSAEKAGEYVNKMCGATTLIMKEVFV
jgi:3-deoxy-D-manno-octulosonic-acid transferase